MELNSVKFDKPEEVEAFAYYSSLFEDLEYKPCTLTIPNSSVCVSTYSSSNIMFGIELSIPKTPYLLSAGLVDPKKFEVIDVLKELGVQDKQRVLTYDLCTKIGDARNRYFWAKPFEIASANFIQSIFGDIDFILCIACKGSDTWNRYADVYCNTRDPFEAATNIGEWFCYDQLGFPYPIGIQSTISGKLQRIRREAVYGSDHATAKKVLQVGDSIKVLYSKHPVVEPYFGKSTRSVFY